MDGGFLSSLARLGVEIDSQSRDWSAHRRPHDVVEDIPLDPEHTAEAASLLLRVVRSLPGRLPLRSMLEPLTQVLLRSVYSQWSWVPSVADYADATITVQSILKWVPFYTLVKGHEGLTETSKAEAVAAMSEAASLRASAEAAETQLALERARAIEFEEKYAIEAEGRVEAEKRVVALQDLFRKLQSDMRTHMTDFTDVQNKHHEAKEDLRDMQRDCKFKDVTITDLRGQVQKYTSVNSRLEEENKGMRQQLAHQKADIDQMPKLKQQIDMYESSEAIHGITFAVRVSKEVFNLELEDICGLSEAQLTKRSNTAAGSAQKTWQAKVVLDTVCTRLKALPRDIDSLKSDIVGLHQQVQEYRNLIPIWNMDAVEDLEDAYNQDAPVHRQVFSMKDRQSFAGLGMGTEEKPVPPYLRAEGFIRHLFVSKAELEDFMSEFTEFFFSATAEHDMSTQSMHNELYQHMRLRFENKKDEDSEALTEFAYAFICSLEAYRYDPDFELFDLMLSGAVHPSIMKDQREMLANIEALTRACQDASGDAEDKGRRRGGAGDKKEQVSRRIIRAVLEVVFPDKKPTRQDALRKALYVTVQKLSDAGKSPGPDSVFTGDLFAATADGSQTPLVEEIRRQHVYEVIEWTCELSRRVLNGRSLKDKSTTIQDKQLLSIINTLDTHRSHVQALELARIGCPEPTKKEHVREVLKRLRHGVLLRPKRLWIRSEAKEVVKQLMVIAHMENGPEADSRTSVVADGEGYTRKTQRIRALKVLNNPLTVMNSDEHNDPDTLAQAVNVRKSIDTLASLGGGGVRMSVAIAGP